MSKYWKSIFLLFLALQTIGLSSLDAQTIRYGFEQDSDNPLRITAVAIPDFSSDNVTVSTAVFSFMVSNSIALSPSIEALPASGVFDNHNGSWIVQKLTEQIYSSVGFDGTELEGNDIYQVVLQNAPEISEVREGQSIPLFSFELANDCQEGRITVLTNNNAVRNAVLRDLQANFNNQMSVSIDDVASSNIYDELDPFSAELECPLLLVSENEPELADPYLKVQPNPATTRTLAILQSTVAGDGDLVLYDIRNREVLRLPTFFAKGYNTIELDLADLPAGKYLLVGTVKDLVLRAPLVKID